MNQSTYRLASSVQITASRNSVAMPGEQRGQHDARADEDTGGGEPPRGEVAALTLLTWSGTVLLADILRRTGRPGPAEEPLRRLIYR